MLYTRAEDFFKNAAKQQRLSLREEKACAQKMKEGDALARQALFDSFLPLLAAFLKRWSDAPSLELIYRGLAVLEKELAAFDFQGEDPSFDRHLSAKLRQMMTSYIADRPR
ncbi:MAG: hypothetical protein IJY89_02315 [Clostridia bacterium]|nr:hypothetical protein [Clostridia bacterium]